jgi:hypothetical protein
VWTELVDKYPRSSHAGDAKSALSSLHADARTPSAPVPGAGGAAPAPKAPPRSAPAESATPPPVPGTTPPSAAPPGSPNAAPVQPK